MCRAKHDHGGRRCTGTPPAERNARRRAVYAARRAGRVTTDPRKDPATYDDLPSLEHLIAYYSPVHREVLADAWAPHDAEFADAIRTLQSEWDAGTSDALSPYWQPASTRIQVRRDIRLDDGTVVQWHPDGWRTATEWMDADEQGGVGLLVKDGPPRAYLAYRMRKATDGSWYVSGRLAHTIRDAAAYLTRSERTALALPRQEPQPHWTSAPTPQEVAPVRQSRPSQAQMTAWLAHARQEAAAAGRPGDRSAINASLLREQARTRGQRITGRVAGPEDWDAVGHHVRPGEQPYWILAPVVDGTRHNAPQHQWALAPVWDETQTDGWQAQTVARALARI